MINDFVIRSSEQDFRIIKQKARQLSRQIARLPNDIKFFERDIINPDEDLLKLKRLREYIQQLIGVLKGQLKGSSYYSRQSGWKYASHLRGRYGNLKGHNIQLQQQLADLIVQVDLLIALVETSYNKDARTLHSTAEALDQIMDKVKNKDLTGSYADIILGAVLLFSYIKRILDKSKD